MVIPMPYQFFYKHSYSMGQVISLLFIFDAIAGTIQGDGLYL
jgi:hypothetical protein